MSTSIFILTSAAGWSTVASTASQLWNPPKTTRTARRRYRYPEAADAIVPGDCSEAQFALSLLAVDIDALVRRHLEERIDRI